MTAAHHNGRDGRVRDGDAPRVVYLDDDDDYRLLLRLAVAGDDAIELVDDATFDDAADLLARTQPDVVLLDATGDRRGLGLLPLLHERASDARVIVLVGFDADDLRGSLGHGRTVGQIAKRTRPTTLAGEIATMVAMLDLVEQAVEAVDADATQLEDQPASARRARTFVDAALRRWGCDDLADTVTLLVSELVANAVMHAHSTAEVTVLLHPGCVRIEVADRDPSIPKRPSTGIGSPSGRGLSLVEQLSRAWGIEPTPTGKYIWFEIARPDHADHPDRVDQPDRADRDAARKDDHVRS